MNLIRARQLEKLSLSIKVVFILVLSTCQLFFSNTVFSSGRPEGITINSAWVGYDLKSGEELPLTDHGWAFSHLRELLPTVDIQIEPQHVIPLRGSPVHPSKINLTLKGKKLNLDDLKPYQKRQINTKPWLVGILVGIASPLIFSLVFSICTIYIAIMLNNIRA